MAEIDLEALARKVEALEGPCRETDVLIALATDWGHPASPCTLRHLHVALGATVAELVKDAESPQMITSQLPRYTASIDAAMSLVPDQAWWWVEAQPLVHGQFFAGCADERVAKGKTPALALTAAALRARLMEGEGEK